MTNKKYVSGRRFEYKVRDDMLKKGALIGIRSAGSKSPYDLVMLFKDKIYLIQCKKNKYSKVENLIYYKDKIEVKSLIAKPNNKKIEYEEYKCSE